MEKGAVQLGASTVPAVSGFCVAPLLCLMVVGFLPGLSAVVAAGWPMSPGTSKSRHR